MSFPIQRICNIMSISKSGFYKWRSRLRNPNDKIIKRSNDILLFTEYHQKYPNHGYRWLKAKILLDLGVVYSDNYAHSVVNTQVLNLLLNALNIVLLLKENTSILIF